MNIKQLTAEKERIGSDLRSARLARGTWLHNLNCVCGDAASNIERGMGGNFATLIRYADELGYQLQIVRKP